MVMTRPTVVARMPIPGAVVSSRPWQPSRPDHQGYDISFPSGPGVQSKGGKFWGRQADFFAEGDGKVMRIGSQSVDVRYGGKELRYIHVAPVVAVGDTVTEGQLLGRTLPGEFPHLHLEAKKDNQRALIVFGSDVIPMPEKRKLYLAVALAAVAVVAVIWGMFKR